MNDSRRKYWNYGRCDKCHGEGRFFTPYATEKPKECDYCDGTGNALPRWAFQRRIEDPLAPENACPVTSAADMVAYARITELEAALGEAEEALSKSLKFWQKMAFSGTSSLAQKMESALNTIRKARKRG